MLLFYVFENMSTAVFVTAAPTLCGAEVCERPGLLGRKRCCASPWGWSASHPSSSSHSKGHSLRDPVA